MLLFLRTTGYCSTPAPIFPDPVAVVMLLVGSPICSFLSRDACCLSAANFLCFAGLRHRFRSCVLPKWFLLSPVLVRFSSPEWFLLVGLSVVVFDQIRFCFGFGCFSFVGGLGGAAGLLWRWVSRCG
ncbi:hypothetical protein P8452_21393 [Trifolium repens]|jgi:hypothetical protein|nr:hypothetical protein QL285_014149 [Trifolium repens]WJX33155.1 hypothetical protein P8452_21393 [Trifolium repens]